MNTTEISTHTHLSLLFVMIRSLILILLHNNQRYQPPNKWSHAVALLLDRVIVHGFGSAIIPRLGLELLLSALGPLPAVSLVLVGVITAINAINASFVTHVFSYNAYL